MRPSSSSTQWGNKCWNKLLGNFDVYLHAKNQLHHSILSFNCKKIANLLFWVNWTCLTTLTKNDNSNLKEPVTFICRQKIKPILQVFLEILQGYCELVFSTLGMPGYANPKWHHQLVENFRTHLQAKNQLHTPCFSGDIAKICKRLILNTLGMPGCKHPKW